MNDDYLWDGSGEPDPEVQRLERALTTLRHNRPAPDFPEEVRPWNRLRLRFWLPRLAAVAAVVLAVVGTWVAVRNTKVARPAWDVARLEGSPKVGARQVGSTARLTMGEWLETDASSRAIINVGTIGQVQVDPATRLKLVETRLTVHRLALERGTIHAMIWAPPGQFIVDTPSAVAVDLGCAYTLQVDDKGGGLVRVTFGWVGFELNGRESFIPAGALCATRPGTGPGTPHFEDASVALGATLLKLDFEKESSEARASDLSVVLANVRKRDAFTLWHLLSRVSGGERGRVYDRLAELVPPPQGVTREGVMRLEKPMLDLWWNQLGLGDTNWWRRWERSWPQQTK